MEKKNIIILVLIVIIVALLVGIFASMPHTTKQDTNLTFKSNATITKGDSIKIQLTDTNGKGIANQTINVTITDKDKSSDYHSVETNDSGIGTLNLDKNAGNYTITISYAGDDNYAGSNATKKITIDEEVVETEPASSSSSSSGSSSSSSDDNAIYYDSKYNIYYNGDGIIVNPDGHHGQSEGSRYSDVKAFYDSGKGME